MTDEIGVQWFEEVFLPNCGDARPHLPVLDSHYNHEVLDMLELAKQNNMNVLVIPPHTTHMLHPLDRVVLNLIRRHTNATAQNSLLLILLKQ